MALNINIYTPGSHDKSMQSLINDYEKRLSRFAELNWVFVKSGDKKSENSNLTKALVNKIYIVLDENGLNVNTLEIANIFSKQMQSGKPSINIVIGGAYGLDEQIVSSAYAVWAFGKITLPHQIVRLITTEQIYRAMAILNNHPYHHN